MEYPLPYGGRRGAETIVRGMGQREQAQSPLGLYGNHQQSPADIGPVSVGRYRDRGGTILIPCNRSGSVLVLGCGSWASSRKWCSGSFG